MHEWVQEFIANTVEMLKEDTIGQLKDSCSTKDASTPADYDAHRELELDMLKHIFSSPTDAPSKEVSYNYSSLTFYLDNAHHFACSYVHEILNF